MEKLTNRSREIADKKMTFLERIYLPAILGGMWITLKHFFRKPATSQYPEEIRPRAEVYRGQHVLKRDDQGKERCTACGLCAVACPAEAITMVAAEREKAKSICIARKNMRLPMKSTCCVAFSVVCVKKPVLKKRFSSLIKSWMLSLAEKSSFTAKTNW